MTNGFPDQAVIAYQAGRREEAERICLAAVKREPLNFDALHMLAALHAERRDWAGALPYFERAATLNSSNAFVQNNLGLALRNVGRIPEAIQHFRLAITAETTFAEAHCNLGAALDAIGANSEALESYDQAIKLDSQLARAHGNRASLLHKLRRLKEALASYDRALSIQPRYWNIHAKRAALLIELGQPKEALANLDGTLEAEPDNWLAYVNKVAALDTLGRFDEALAASDRAATVAPENAVVHNARGGALTLAGRHTEALTSFNRAMDLDPQYAEAHWNASLCLLRLGRLQEGWALHEWRKKLPRPLGARPRAGQEWNLKEPLTGCRLLVVAEQGLGDSIQFCRFATLAARAGATVVLEVPSPLKGLLSSLEGVAATVDQSDPLPPIDFSCSMLSLPFAFGTTLETLAARTPYLFADTKRVEAWQVRLGPNGKLRVGLVWSGGQRADQPELAATNLRRNLPLKLLAPLKHQHIEFYSLQKGEAAESELRRTVRSGWDGPEVLDFSSHLHDFADTAALMEQLDLVISVDTSTAHLAGALGKPVWILNRFDSCWRWLTDRADSPWYPTARLYRQIRPGDWQEVVQRVRSDLCALVADQSARAETRATPPSDSAAR